MHPTDQAAITYHYKTIFLTASLETPAFGTISINVIADIILRESILASMSLDSVAGSSLHLVIDQQKYTQTGCRSTCVFKKEKELNFFCTLMIAAQNKLYSALS